MKNKPTIVVTTIQAPTPSMEAWSRKNLPIIVVGDRKGPSDYPLKNVIFRPFDPVRLSMFSLEHDLPCDNYARKNLGYLLAMQQGAPCIYETDDDNAPTFSWKPRNLRTPDNTHLVGFSSSFWVNVYRRFVKQSEVVWPRGLPLTEIHNSGEVLVRGCARNSCCPIQQGLANSSPDVDAIWRLTQDRPVIFDSSAAPVILNSGSWCPFNSQSTWWWPEAYPLMYLPSHCSFRMTDIWRSFVAQRCLWSMLRCVIFHPAEVVQERNQHNLMKDFEQEVPGYLRNAEMAKLLYALTLTGDPRKDLVTCYQELVKHHFFPSAELHLLDLWLSDLQLLKV